MGLRGFPPVPTAILKARGSWLAPARAKRGEPQPKLGAPRCPAYLSDGAKEVWYQVCPQLKALGTLAITDGAAIARYCETFILWKRAAEFLTSHESLVYPIVDKDGTARGVAPWPQNALYDRYHRILTSIEDRFGLTPSARTRIATTKAIGNAALDGDKSRFFCAG